MYKSCTVEDCTSKVLARSFCIKHYKRVYRYGDVHKLYRAGNGNRKKHPLYSTYTNLLTRCYNEKNQAFAGYGGRGITVCDRWLGVSGFDNFCEDMGNKPSATHSIDRIDNDGNYSAVNCKWSDKEEQAHNRRIRCDNKTGVPGVVQRNNGKYTVYICRSKVRRCLGTFNTLAKASLARREAELAS